MTCKNNNSISSLLRIKPTRDNYTNYAMKILNNWLYIGKVFIIFLFYLTVSCSTEDFPDQVQYKGSKTIRLCLNAAIPTFDSTGTRAVREWPDKATLYFKFLGNHSITAGTGVYSKFTNDWLLTYSGSLDSDEEQSCYVWFIENNSGVSKSNVNMTLFSCVYNDSEAKYVYSKNEEKLFVNAHLRPLSARLRISGVPGTELKLNGWPYAESFNSETCIFSVSEKPIYLTIDNNGYTPYIYGNIENSDIIKLDLSQSSYSYLRQFKSADFMAGRSYELKTPFEDSVLQTKWQLRRLFTIDNNDKTITFKMIKVEAGTYEMGRAGITDVATPVHTVSLTKDYYICETEVTQALWYAVMGQSPTSGGSQWNNTYGLGDERPAYYISYSDCQSFLTALNGKLSSQLGSGEQFRFPTEAEWEFAAKGGNKSQGYTYSGSDNINNVAWYTGNSSSTTHPVKTKSPNELGLYDMNGNVCEWCYDWYGSYSTSAQTDPTGPASGSTRVYRGGGWGNNATYCRVASRHWDSPAYRGYSVGFRLAL